MNSNEKQEQSVKSDAKKMQTPSTDLQVTKCELRATVDENGNIRVIEAKGECKAIINQLPPIKKRFITKRMTEQLKEEIVGSGNIETPMSDSEAEGGDPSSR